MDKSNGYEKVAPSFIEYRGRNINGTGAKTDRTWVRTLSQGATVLDLGCGTGFPISKVFIDEGMAVYGIDASATMVKEFQQNIPEAQVAYESVEDSLFFSRQFDAIISWGLIFLLTKEAQVKVIQKAADALKTGGKLLFTSPEQETEWIDIMTKLPSRSLGARKYKEILSESGLILIEEFEDEAGNHYYSAIKN